MIADFIMENRKSNKPSWSDIPDATREDLIAVLNPNHTPLTNLQITLRQLISDNFSPEEIKRLGSSIARNFVLDENID